MKKTNHFITYENYLTMIKHFRNTISNATITNVIKFNSARKKRIIV